MSRRDLLRLVVGALLVEGHSAVAAAPGEPGPELGRAAPDFTLSDLAGRPVRLGDYQSRKAVLVNFWATWCVPCQEEMPTLERLYQQRRQTLEVLGISVDTVRIAAVRTFVRELGLSFPILLDSELTVGRKYRVRALPVSYVVDRAGFVRHREIGYRDWTDRESQFIVDEALRAR